MTAIAKNGVTPHWLQTYARVSAIAWHFPKRQESPAFSAENTAVEKTLRIGGIIGQAKLRVYNVRYYHALTIESSVKRDQGEVEEEKAAKSRNGKPQKLGGGASQCDRVA